MTDDSLHLLIDEVFDDLATQARTAVYCSAHAIAEDQAADVEAEVDRARKRLKAELLGGGCCDPT